MNIDKLCYERIEAREQNNWQRSDEIRDLLDKHNVFCVDALEGQEVYHFPLPVISRKDALSKATRTIWRH